MKRVRGCFDDGVAEGGAGAGAEIDDAGGKAGFFEDFHEAGGDGGRIAGGFEDDSVAGDDGGGGHAGHDGEGEIPRGDDGADAERDVVQLIAFARILDGRGGGGEAQGFAGVELKEVDGLAYVGVGFGPVLADFVGEPCAEVEMIFADDVGGVEEERSTLFRRDEAPGSEGFEGGLDGGSGMLGSGLLMGADNLCGARWVGRHDFAGGAQAFAADDEGVLVAELFADAGEGLAHGVAVLVAREVGEGLVAEGALRFARQDDGGFCGGSHDSLV